MPAELLLLVVVEGVRAAPKAALEQICQDDGSKWSAFEEGKKNDIRNEKHVISSKT